MTTTAFTGRMNAASMCAMLVATGGCAGGPPLDTVSPAELAVNRAIEAKAGIGGERIAASGYGEGYPVASNGTMACRQQNRRVEIVVSEHPQQVGVSREQ